MLVSLRREYYGRMEQDNLQYNTVCEISDLESRPNPNRSPQGEFEIKYCEAGTSERYSLTKHTPATFGSFNVINSHGHRIWTMICTKDCCARQYYSQ